MDAAEYHLQTKHRPERFSKPQSHSEWANRLKPYKSYFEAKKLFLNKLSPPRKPYEKLYLKNADNPITPETLSLMLRYSLAINAKKIHNPNSGYVRVNPSYKNLHPEEIYLIYKNALYHFNVKEFCLEEIAKSDKTLIKEGFLIIINSIPFRTSWKYGKRALRYCLLDTGHIIAALRFSTNLLGWNMKYAGFEKEFKEFFSAFKYPRNEEELFEAAFFVYEKKPPQFKIKDIKNLSPTDSDPLAKEKTKRDIIFKTAKKLTLSPKPSFIRTKPSFSPSPFSAYEIIDNRRSALGFKKNYISKNDFLDILDKTLHRKIPPFDVEITQNLIDFVIFVNRVEGVKSGIYYFDRQKNSLNLLEKGDFSETAKFINCFQDTAKNSAFTINMTAPFPTNENYKSIMFESGMIGEILYLEAEAKGMRGCATGCFFDDLITKEILNDKNKIATLGFSIGVPLMNERIIKL